MVGRNVRVQLRTQIAEDLGNSVAAFRDFQQEREIAIVNSAGLLANLPSLKALMTTRDAATIQDASIEIWKLAPNDVFVLADPSGKVMAIHTNAPGMTAAVAENLLKGSLNSDEPSFWWYGAGHLYQVFLQPIYFGTPKNGTLLGVLGVGHEISNALASEVARIASSQVAFFYGDKLIAGTVGPVQSPALAQVLPRRGDSKADAPAEVRLGSETFLATTVQLAPMMSPGVRLSVLKSYDKATVFLGMLNRRLLGVGLVAVLLGCVVVFLVSHTFTKPLANLIAGLHALEKGDFTYPLPNREGDEISELTSAFVRMRTSMQQTQHELLASERLATIGRTASSISHDLRHPLTAVVANAEFLCDAKLNAEQREELYSEIRTAVDQLTDLVDSLLEFSQARESLRRIFAPVEDAVERALRKVRAHPEFHKFDIPIVRLGPCETWFDQRKVERALVNHLLNACEFVPRENGSVEVQLDESAGMIEIRVVDNGPGVDGSIREKLFLPFVSFGKQNGIGLGLAISQKIFQDHGGDACLEGSEPGRTVFKLTLPIVPELAEELNP
jgi:signal transduction histidine kinase